METIARPYARAAFHVAQETGRLDAWSHFLKFLASCLADKFFAAHLMNPTITKEEKVERLRDLSPRELDSHQQNFLQLILLNNRIGFVLAMVRLFEEMKLKQAQEAVAQIKTAFPLDKAEETRLMEFLSRRSGGKVNLAMTVDPDLKGGLIIELDGKTTDYSIKGKLDKLRRNF